jgi:hypothetical protein
MVSYKFYQLTLYVSHISQPLAFFANSLHQPLDSAIINNIKLFASVHVSLQNLIFVNTS